MRSWMVAGLILTLSPLGLAGPPDSFDALFNGHDLTGWWGAETENPREWMALPPDDLTDKKQASLSSINSHWTVENGELVNDGQGLYLTSDRLFQDFELRLEYRTVAGGDSGIYLRGFPQVQIWDTTEAGGNWPHGADKGSGGLWNNAPGSAGKDPLVHADRPLGEWNSVRVVMVGERVTVHLNDRLVVDQARLENYFDPALPLTRAGPIQLQTHGSEVRWRNIFVREIGTDEANDILAAHASVDFEPIFNAHDLTGWSGSLESYEVVDGAIRCKPGEGGTIYTDQSFDDFSARMLIQIPPGGNNGLAIRYPGQGDPAYEGMCEIQILDNDALQYADLDPRQFHGSAYGMVAAHRGYLREPGQWNFEEVTVSGSRILVELNGTRILDADLASVTDFLHDPSTFKGRSRTSGHFGFAGHGEPVAFRDLAIKRLDAHADGAQHE